MKKNILVAIISLMTVHLTGQEFTEGIWKTGENNTKIESYQKEGMWFGRITSSDNPKAKIGRDILISFKKVDSEWKGKLYAAKRGKTMDAVIDPGNEVLKITISAGLFKKNLEWRRDDNASLSKN